MSYTLGTYVQTLHAMDIWCLSPAHTCPDISESLTFSLRIQKFPSPHFIGFVVDLLVATLKSGFKHIQTHRKKGKGKVAGSKMSKCMWMEPRYMWRKQGEDLIDNIPLKLTNTLPSV